MHMSRARGRLDGRAAGTNGVVIGGGQQDGHAEVYRVVVKLDDRQLPKFSPSSGVARTACLSCAPIAKPARRRLPYARCYGRIEFSARTPQHASIRPLSCVRARYRSH